MSKYRKRGAYHFEEYKNPNSIYRKHALCVLQEIGLFNDVNYVLDVGAGEGFFCWLLGREGLKVVGWEVDKEALRLAAVKGQPVVYGDATKLNWEPGFDLILMLDMLEHIAPYQRETVLEEAARAAKKIFIAIPDRPDEHAEGEIPEVAWITDTMDALGFGRIHFDTRHARHVLLFESYR